MATHAEDDLHAAYQRRYPLVHRVALGGSVVYLAALALIAFWPLPVDRGMHGSITTAVVWLQDRGLPSWLGYSTIEFGANIALFLPLGVFVVAVAGLRRWWLGPLLGTVASSAIELGQLLFLPDRFATINDIAANTLGALVGSGLAVFAGQRSAVAETTRMR